MKYENIDFAEKTVKYIFRASYVDKNGVKHYAKHYGKRAFKIPVNEN